MKTLAICLTTVFVTLKVLNLISWPWFWIISPIMMYTVSLLILSSIFNAWKKYQTEQDEQIKKEHRSRWQQRLDSIRAATEELKQMNEERSQKPTDTVKTIILLVVACAILHSCTSSYGIMRCPKQPPYTFKK